MSMTPANGNQELHVSVQDGYLDMSPSSKSFPKNYNGIFYYCNNDLSFYSITSYSIEWIDSQNMITKIISTVKKRICFFQSY